MSRYAHREEYKAKFEGLVPQKDTQILVAVSPEASYFKNGRLDALLIGLGKIDHAEKITFLVGDTLQRHTAYMKHFGVIYQFKTLMKKALATHGVQNERAWGQILVEHVERLLGNPKLMGAVATAIREEGDWEAVFDEGVWAQCAAEALDEGRKWTSKTTKKAQFFYGQKLVTNPGALFKDPLVKKDRVLNFTLWDEHHGDNNGRYLAARELIETEYRREVGLGEENRFAKLINTAAEAYTTKFMKEHNSPEYCFPKMGEENYEDFKAQMLELCTRYLLEESAVFWNLMEESHWSAFVYPFYQNDTNPTLYNCIAELCVSVAKSSKTEVANIMRPVSVGFEKQPEPEQVHHTTKKGHTKPQAIVTQPQGIPIPTPTPTRDSYSNGNRSRSSSNTVTLGGSPPAASMMQSIALLIQGYNGYSGTLTQEERFKTDHLALTTVGLLSSVYQEELGRTSPISSPEHTDDELEPLDMVKVKGFEPQGEKPKSEKQKDVVSRPTGAQHLVDFPGTVVFNAANDDQQQQQQQQQRDEDKAVISDKEKLGLY